MMSDFSNHSPGAAKSGQNLAASDAITGTPKYLHHLQDTNLGSVGILHTCPDKCSFNNVQDAQHNTSQARAAHMFSTPSTPDPSFPPSPVYSGCSVNHLNGPAVTHLGCSDSAFQIHNLYHYAAQGFKGMTSNTSSLFLHCHWNCLTNHSNCSRSKGQLTIYCLFNNI